MALIRCPECGKEISDLSSACVHCGYPLSQLPDDAPACSLVLLDDQPGEKMVLQTSAGISICLRHRRSSACPTFPLSCSRACPPPRPTRPPNFLFPPAAWQGGAGQRHQKPGSHLPRQACGGQPDHPPGAPSHLLVHGGRYPHRLCPVGAYQSGFLRHRGFSLICHTKRPAAQLSGRSFLYHLFFQSITSRFLIKYSTPE